MRCPAPSRPPEICRSISATASGWGSFSPQVCSNNLPRRIIEQICFLQIRAVRDLKRWSMIPLLPVWLTQAWGANCSDQSNLQWLLRHTEINKFRGNLQTSRYWQPQKHPSFSSTSIPCRPYFRNHLCQSWPTLPEPTSHQIPRDARPS